MWSRDGFTNLAVQTEADVGGNELAISDAANTVALVSHRRQLELRGSQAIIGPGVKIFPLATLSIEGGADGQVLTTNGIGVLRWATPAVSTTYNFRRGLTEAAGTVDLNFASNTEIGGVFVPPGTAPAGGLLVSAAGALTLEPATATVRGGGFVPPAGAAPNGGLGLAANGGLSLLAGSATVRGGCYVPTQPTPPAGGLTIAIDGGVSLNPGTNTIRGGCYVPPAGAADPPGLRIDVGGAIRTLVATGAEAQLGADNARPITSLVLQLGPVTGTGHPSLPTTYKTILGSIAELHRMIQGATGQLTIVGTFDASSATYEVTPVTGSPHPAGPLRVASQQTLGWFLIVDTEGMPTGRTDIPSVLMRPGDLLIGVEDAAQANTYHWGHLGIGQAQITASNVVVTAITGLNADNVQDALEELQVNKAEQPLLIDAVSLSGDGQASDLAVNIVDGGTF
jgi:hypothetical protein